MIVAATGHRLHLLPGYRGDGSSQVLRTILLETAMAALDEWNPDLTISGMATGWDMAVAAACMLTNRPYHCYIPFAGQHRLWGQADQSMYISLLEEAAEVVTICNAETSYSYIARDEAMVDKADRMIALYLGDPTTGTGRTIQYAEGWLVPVTNYAEAYRSRLESKRAGTL
ncbi:MAG: DUF357 domain-containing protein [Phycisphaerales bacterium]|nr:DUF357 domain-containing protein [Phycisphaerales bacterium]